MLLAAYEPLCQSESRGKALIESKVAKGFFQVMINGNPALENDPIIQKFLAKGQQKWYQKKLSPETFRLLQDLGLLTTESTSTTLFCVANTIKIFNKPHSNIAYKHFSHVYLGSIIDIVQLPNHPVPLLIVESLLPLNSSDHQKSPYASLPEILEASVVYDKYSEVHCIQCDDVRAQLVVVPNIAGTFGIDQKTLSVVALSNIVSLLHNH